MSGGIIVNNLDNEQQFAAYLARRGELRDCIRFGVYPNIKRLLALHLLFLADYGPGGPSHDAQLWAYYQDNIEPLAAHQAAMIDNAAGVVDMLEQVERATPGTFGIELPGTMQA